MATAVDATGTQRAVHLETGNPQSFKFKTSACTHLIKCALMALLCCASVVTIAASVTYTYDVHGRLKTRAQVIGANIKTVTYSYDNASNRTQVVTTTALVDLLQTPNPDGPLYASVLRVPVSENFFAESRKSQEEILAIVWKLVAETGVTVTRVEVVSDESQHARLTYDTTRGVLPVG
jgi:hypothetical protein